MLTAKHSTHIKRSLLAHGYRHGQWTDNSLSVLSVLPAGLAGAQGLGQHLAQVNHTHLIKRTFHCIHYSKFKGKPFSGNLKVFTELYIFLCPSFENKNGISEFETINH